MEPAERRVPISGDRVKWGLAARNLSQREAGRRIAARFRGAGVTRNDENSVAMSILKIVRGQSRKCDPDLRKALAQLLDLPVRWLSGERNRLPHTFDNRPQLTGPFTDNGQFEYQRLKAFVSITERKGRVDAEDESRPNRRQIAEYRFWKVIDPLLERRAITDSHWAMAVMTCLKELVDPAWWRLKTSLPATGRADQDKDQDYEETLFPAWRKGAESAEESEAREALMKAFRYILKPWISGRADLDLAKLAKTADLEGVSWVHQVIVRQQAKSATGGG